MRETGFVAAFLLCFAAGLMAQLTAPISNFFIPRIQTADNVIGNGVASFTQNDFDPDTVDYELSVRFDSVSTTSSIIHIALAWNGESITQTDTVNPTWVYYWPKSGTVITGTSIPQDSLFTFTFTAPSNENELFRARSYRATLADLITQASFDYQKLQGNAYHVSTDSSLAGGNDTLAIGIVTPNNGKYLHLNYEATVSAKCWFFIKTGVTIGAFADTLTARNDNLNSSNTSSAVFIKAPRTAATGTLIFTKLLGSAIEAGDIDDKGQFITLAPNTRYSIGVHATAASDCSLILHLLEYGEN